MEKKINRIKLIILLCIILASGVISERYISKYKGDYKNAINLLEQDKPNESIEAFNKLKKYKLYKIDENIIEEYIQEANKKIDQEDKYILAETLFYNKNYFDSLKNYFMINDKSSKYYRYSQERIEDVFYLYIKDTLFKGDINLLKNSIQELLNYIESEDRVSKELYEDSIDLIKKVQSIIEVKGINGIIPKQLYLEEDFYIDDSEFGIKKVVNKINGLSDILKISGEYSDFDSYYIYKISGDFVGKYKLILNYKGYSEIIEGNIEDVKNTLQVYRLPKKPEYGDYMLVNLILQINGEEIHTNFISKYNSIDLQLQ